MRLVSYSDGQTSQAGVLVGDRVYCPHAAAVPISMLDFIAGGPDALEHARQVVGIEEGVPLSSVKLLAPIPNPSKIVAIGLNYMDHCREQGVEPPTQPLVFAKFPSSIIGPGEPISWDPKATQQVDYEVELGVVIGKTARNVSPEEALTYVFGYTILNDISARDLQFGDGQWVRGKSLDTFCPTGPSIVTADEIPDPQTLTMRCFVNGELLQDSTTAEMIFGVADLVSYVSRYITLQPGDLMATGTPYGVGVFRDPKVFLKDGDIVVAEIDGIGKLDNPVQVRG